MAIIPPLPQDFSCHPFYVRMSNRGSAGTECLSKVNNFSSISESLADLVIAGPFRNYTLHNRGHARKLIHLMQYIIPSDVIHSLDCLEYLLLIYSAYLHDLGLTITSHEREEIITSDDFLDYIKGWPELWSRIVNIRENLSQIECMTESNNESLKFLLEAQLYQLQEAAICSMLRPGHAAINRYQSLIEQISISSGRNDLFEYQGVSFTDTLIQICVSHNQDAAVLAEVYSPYDERFPRCQVFSGQTVNTQFCAAILRLADILDFDRERTPRILFDSLNIGDLMVPGSEVSLSEWQKHMAIHSLEIRQDEFVVYAECAHPVIEKTIRDFCLIIERELRDIQAVLRHNTRDVQEKYYLNLPINVRPQIISRGYTYKNLSLQINQAAITSLLMGDRLYSQPYTFIRELIQNSIDAISARKLLDDSKEIIPKIIITSQIDEQGYCWIELEDNGIGMDEHVLGEYFLTLGNTYYESPEFIRQVKFLGKGEQFISIARFEIGIISVFMIGDVLEVTTRRFHSPRGDEKGRKIRIERMGGLAFVTDINLAEFGTKVRLRLKSEYNSKPEKVFSNIKNYLDSFMIRPLYNIQIELGDFNENYTQRPYMTITEEGKKYLSKLGLEAFTIDVSRWSKHSSGRIILILARTPEGKLSNRHNNKRIILGSRTYPGILRINPYNIFKNYNGNRIIVNGFQLSLKGLSKIFGGLKIKLPVIFDISVIGDPKVEYDVSRSRITGEGKVFIKKEIIKCFRASISELGIINDMTEETRAFTEKILERKLEKKRLLP